MKKTIVFLLFICLSFAAMAGNKKKLFPKVKDGGTIDADFLNQVTTTIENKVLGFQIPDEILGQWECTNITIGCGNDVGTFDGGIIDHGWYQTRTQILTFSQDQSGDFAYSTDEQQLLGCRDDLNYSCSGHYSVLNNMFLYIQEAEGGTVKPIPEGPFMYPLDKFSDNSFNIQVSNSVVISCQRLNVAPDFPTALEAVHDSTSDIMLTWSDNSITEDGFNVYRRTIIDPTADIPDYLMIQATDPDVNTHTDSDCVGDCYYKIRAFNTNGESAASNVVKMTIE